MDGLVIKSTGSWYTVKNCTGDYFECKLKGKFRIKGIKTTNPVAVGDRVNFELLPDKNKGLINKIYTRSNYIIRKATKLSKQSHIIAANIDQAYIIATITNPKTSTGFIDRFLVTAEAYSIKANIVFNKTDIYNKEDLLLLDKLMRIYSSIGYNCYSVSALEGNKIDELKTTMINKTNLFSGHSGVGKSTLVNSLQSNLNVKTGDISDYHLKGKHVTSYYEMYELSIGGYIIDTPGLKEFGLYEFEKSELCHFFPEMREVMNNCFYNDCTHSHEPDCAVKKAVSEGSISQLRYDSYLRMLDGKELENEIFATKK